MNFSSIQGDSSKQGKADREKRLWWARDIRGVEKLNKNKGCVRDHNEGNKQPLITPGIKSPSGSTMGYQNGHYTRRRLNYFKPLLYRANEASKAEY